MEMISRKFAEVILSRNDLASFWEGLGGICSLPDTFSYLLLDSGVFVLEPVMNNYGIHVGLFPNRRGHQAIRDGRQVIKTIQQSGKALARIRRTRRDACFFAAQCGMRRYLENATHIFYEA